MSRTLPSAIRVPGYDQPVVFPDSMSDDDVYAALGKLAPPPAPQRSMGMKVIDTVSDALPATGALVGGALATPPAIAGALPSFGASSLLIPGAGAAGYGGGEFLKRKLDELTHRPGKVSPVSVAQSAASGATDAMAGYVGGEAGKLGLSAVKRVASVAPELAEAFFPKTAKAIDILRRGRTASAPSAPAMAPEVPTPYQAPPPQAPTPAAAPPVPAAAVSPMPAPPPVNIFEKAARSQKVAELVKAIDANAGAHLGADLRDPRAAEAIASLPATWWEGMAQASGVNKPSPETIQQAVQFFKDRAAQGALKAAP